MRSWQRSESANRLEYEHSCLPTHLQNGGNVGSWVTETVVFLRRNGIWTFGTARPGGRTTTMRMMMMMLWRM